MPLVAPAQTAMNSGEISPLMLGRVDFAKYKNAMSLCYNHVVLTQGPATRRPGTMFVAEAKDSAKRIRGVRFEFSTTQAYFLEFGDFYIRVYKDHGRVIGAPLPTTSYANTGGQGDRTAIITLTTNQAWDLGTTDNLVDGVVASAAGDGVNLPNTAVAGKYVVFDFGAAKYIDELTLNSSVAHTATWRIEGSADNVEWDTLNAAVTIGSVGDNVIALTNVSEVGYRYYRIMGVSGNYNGGWWREFTFKIADPSTSSGPIEIATPYSESILSELKFTQSADTLYIVHPSQPQTKLTRRSHTSWTLSQMTFEDGPYLPTNTGTSTLTASATTGAAVNITASATTDINGGLGWLATDVGRHVRIKTTGAKWGWGRIVSITSTTVAVVTVIQAFGATTSTAEWRLGAWSGTTGYPGVVTFYEDRLVYAGQTALPQTIFGSRIGSYQNFAPTAYDTSGTVADDKGYSFTLNSNNVQVIRWMCGDEKGLLIGTYSAEWVLRASTAGQALSPTNVTARQTTKYGSSQVAAVQAGKATLFVQKSGRKIREFAYDYAIDGFRAPNMMILSEHMTLSGIVDMDFQQEPHSVLWCALANGTLLAFTYDREQNEFGWAGGYLGGTSSYGGDPAAVESVVSIPSPDGTYDELWLVVRRYINGQVVRYIEYMTKFWETGDNQAEAVYLDCAATYNNPGVPVSSITSGLDHVKNATLSVIVDGAEHPNVTVSNTGTVELERAGEIITLGFPYPSRGASLRFDAGSANGTAQGKLQRIHKVCFRLLDSLGLKVGPDFDHLDEVKETYRSMSDNLGEAPALFTGDARVEFAGDSTTEALICWEFSTPFPGTVLLMAPQMTTEDNL